MVDPFPFTSYEYEQHDAKMTASCWTSWFGDDKLLKRAYVLDRIDTCHRGHTLSQARVKQSLPPNLCTRCELATRAAVETFFESSSRAHITLCAREWLDETLFDVSGGRLELLVDAMWEAVFVDRSALRVEDGEYDQQNRDAERLVVNPLGTTRKLLTFLFVVARSLLDSCHALQPVGKRVKDRLHSKEWWEEYWGKVASHLSGQKSSGTTFDYWLDTIKTLAMRDMIIGDMKEVVRLLRTKCEVLQRTAMNAKGEELAFGSLCSVDGCNLVSQTTLIVSTTAEV